MRLESAWYSHIAHVPMQRVPYTFHSPVRTLLTQRVNNSRSYGSKSANPLPYPTQENPQPHHIFHLPRNANQEDVKRRYFELVRIYHPDSAVARHYPPEVSQARFQAISNAYDILRGKTSSSGEPIDTRKVDPMRSARSYRPHFDDPASDERWKERVIMGAVLLTLVAFVAQTSWTRQQAIAEMSIRAPPGHSSVNSRRGDGDLAAGHGDGSLSGSINNEVDLHRRR